MSRRPLALLTLLLLHATSARGDYLLLGIDQTIGVQSNVFKTPVAQVTEGNYELRPSIRLLRREGRLTYDLRYAPAIDVYFTTDQLNGVNHFARGTIGYAPIPTGLITLRADIADYQSIRSSADTGPDGIPDVTPGALGRVTRVFGDLGYEQRITPSTIATGEFGIQGYAYTSENNVDTLGFNGQATLIHELRSNIALGGSLFGSHRRFAERPTQSASRNVVLNANFILRAEPLQTVFLELKGGPALIYTRQDASGGATVNRFNGLDTDFGTVASVFDISPPDGCLEAGGEPVLQGCPLAPAPALSGQLGEQVFVDYDPGERPAGRDDDQWTGFFGAVLRKEDSWGYASLDFLRSEDASAGIGSTTIRNSLTGTVLVEPGWDWTVRLRGNWNQRKATTFTDRSLVRAGPSTVATGTGLFYAEANGLIPNLVQSPTEITQYWVDLTVGRPVWRERLSIELGFRYLSQERSEPNLAEFNRFNNIVGSLTFRYEFAPIEYLD